MITCDKCNQEIISKKDLHKVYVYPQGFEVDFPMQIDLCVDCAISLVGKETFKKFYNYYLEVDNDNIS